jgi:hypothetical protein
MSHNEIPSPEIIKARAKEMRQSMGGDISHSQCLNEIVKQYGFKSFSGYLYYLNPERKKGDGNPIMERNRK